MPRFGKGRLVVWPLLLLNGVHSSVFWTTVLGPQAPSASLLSLWGYCCGDEYLMKKKESRECLQAHCVSHVGPNKRGGVLAEICRKTAELEHSKKKKNNPPFKRRARNALCLCSQCFLCYFCLTKLAPFRLVSSPCLFASHSPSPNRHA